MKLLSEDEKAYLELILGIYKDKIIRLIMLETESAKWISIEVAGKGYVNLPDIKNFSWLKFNGIEHYKAYTLEELGLFEGEIER